ncbi:XRE family transcriptional regulator [Caulobacter segnis]|uniref:Transcriptional regulator, XRE family n=2 Tax=Caulobacter segnis TaxID=88688 RepID=D5VKJ0_CAUST|nr:helix-turn-helix transcriptional regulator [Caulobacter segnis]ADG11013.1 transcriptional regulator, XRE family [Caulobacter segnis ATCC 21756]AVQ02703.1 XRE family transcriptional regulator [Caulobacter segnis]
MAKVEEQLGAVVKHHRKRLGLTQSQLAERIDRQPGTVQSLEAGNAPTFETLVRLASVFDIHLRDLFGIGDYAIEEGRSDPLVSIVQRLSGLSAEELQWVDELLAVTLRFRPS